MTVRADLATPVSNQKVPPRIDAARTITPPVTGSCYCATNLSEWQSTDAPGFWTKLIYQNDALSQSTLLMKVEPGALSESHAHEEFEQIFVLEGSFFDDEHELHAGDYCCRAPGAQHTAGSRDGAVVLIIYTRP